VTSKLHQTVKGVTEDIGEFKYNTAIAKIMELVNAYYEKNISDPDSLKPLALLLAPFVPHMSEELWVEVLGQPFSIHKASWPSYDAKFIASDMAPVIVQVNGKMRTVLSLETLTSKSEDKVTELAKKDEKVAKWLKGSKIKKTIFVPGKLVNFVV
jgi:leucyl-tRNA synthetase